MAEWQYKDDTHYLHVNGYANCAGKDIMADFSYSSRSKVALVIYKSEVLDIRADSEEEARKKVEDMVKNDALKQIAYYRNIVEQIAGIQGRGDI